MGDDQPDIQGAQAALIAQWQATGFIHGVVNTDNMLLSGETVDYGPCAFMDTCDPQTVYSSIDVGGRYAYRNQPGVAQWNLANFAQAILTLLDDDSQQSIAAAQQAVDGFPGRFGRCYRNAMLKKIGLLERQDENNEVLLQDLLDSMAQAKADFTLTFRHLADIAAGTANVDVLPEALHPRVRRW